MYATIGDMLDDLPGSVQYRRQASPRFDENGISPTGETKSYHEAWLQIIEECDRNKRATVVRSLGMSRADALRRLIGRVALAIGKDENEVDGLTLPEFAAELPKCGKQASDTKGVSLFDAAQYFESGDDRAARDLVARWHDAKAITAEPIGKCPTDGRAMLYRLPEILEDMARINGLDAREKNKLRQQLRARLRRPRE